MHRLPAASALLALFLLASCASLRDSGQTFVDRAVHAMGGAEALANLRSVQAKGETRQWEPEQSDVPGGDMRFANEMTFTFEMDRATRASRTDFVKKFAYPAPRTFTFSEIVTPTAGYVIGIDSNGRNAQNLKADPPAHTMSGLRLAATQRELRRADVAALLLAMYSNTGQLSRPPALAVEGRNLPQVAYREFTVAFDPQTGLPARIRTLDYDNVWGDVTYDAVLSDWQNVQGVQVPMLRRYELNGRVISETRITGLRHNGAVEAARLEIPPLLFASARRPAADDIPYQWIHRRQFIGTYMDSDNVSYDTQASGGLRLQEVAPGVHHLQGGTHNSLLVELRDHLVVFDAPVTDAQSVWVVNAARMRFPGKPIRFLVLTHHHMDHSGGLRGFLAGGATLVVGQGAGAHFRRVLTAPTTRNPDLKGADFSRTQIVEVADRWTTSDGSREVQAFLMDSPHAKGTLLGYVPHARIGFVTDIWSPGTAFPAKPNPGLMSVVAAVKKANIQPERFVGGHGTISDYNLLVRFIGQ